MIISNTDEVKSHQFRELFSKTNSLALLRRICKQKLVWFGIIIIVVEVIILEMGVCSNLLQKFER